MIALGIETSGRTGSVALCDEDHLLAALTLPEGPGHARDIVPAVDRVIADAGLGRRSVDVVAVSEGPGSFNGLRIGIACAKTLAFALGWRCVGVPSLEAMVQRVEPDECGAICPVLDARRERVYGAVFRWDEGWHDATGVLCTAPEALAERIPEGALVFGGGVRAYPHTFAPDRFRIGPEELAVCRAEDVARLGIRRVAAGLAVDPMRLMPRYYRLTAPEEKLSAQC